MTFKGGGEIGGDDERVDVVSKTSMLASSRTTSSLPPTAGPQARNLSHRLSLDGYIARELALLLASVGVESRAVRG